jgi:hypothetical protein
MVHISEPIEQVDLRNIVPVGAGQRTGGNRL